MEDAADGDDDDDGNDGKFTSLKCPVDGPELCVGDGRGGVVAATKAGALRWKAARAFGETSADVGAAAGSGGSTYHGCERSSSSSSSFPPRFGDGRLSLARSVDSEDEDAENDGDVDDGGECIDGTSRAEMVLYVVRSESERLGR